MCVRACVCAASHSERIYEISHQDRQKEGLAAPPVGEGMEQLQFSRIAGGSRKRTKILKALDSVYKLQHASCPWPVILLLHFHPREIQTYVHKEAYKNVYNSFIAYNKKTEGPKHSLIENG